MNRYNIANDDMNVFQLDQTNEYHSLLPNLYFYKFYEHNIGYILHEPKTKSLLLFDNGDYESSKIAINKVQKMIGDDKLEPDLIFTTHHHKDVCNSNKEWKKNHPKVEIFSGNCKAVSTPDVTFKLDELDKVNIGDLEVQCMYTPGHTEDHVSYLVFDKKQDSNKTPLVFCGNSAFNAGWAASYSEMYTSLYLSFLKIMSLPTHSRILPSWDYTVDNLRFASLEFPENKDIIIELKKAMQNAENGIPNIGYTIRKERKINPFILIQTMINKETGEPKEFSQRAIDFSKLRIKKDSLI